MAGHFTIKSFVRQSPPQMLQRLLHSKSHFMQFNFELKGKALIESFTDEWERLGDRDRTELEAEFRELHEMSCEKGWLAIKDEAESNPYFSGDELRAFKEKLSDLEGYFERAFATFLNFNDLWVGARHFCHADFLRGWRKRYGIPKVEPDISTNARKAMTNAVSEFYYRREGRGKNCEIDLYKRTSRDYFFFYPEDCAQQSIEYVDGELKRRPHNPAFELIMNYDREAGSLDTLMKGDRKSLEAMQLEFARHILHLDALPNDPTCEQVYNFEPFKAGALQFEIDPNGIVENVEVTSLRLSSQVTKGSKIIIDGYKTRLTDGVYDQFARIGPSMPIELYNVTRVELKVLINRGAGKAAKAKRVILTYPNSCNLKYDGEDLAIRQMLANSGMEPLAKVSTADSEQSEQLQSVA